MITIEALRAYGASVDEGLERCMNNEAFYLKMVEKVLGDKAYDELESAVAANDKAAAFEAAHKLKGVLGNLALTPAYTTACEMVEHLRAGDDADYGAYLAELLKQRNALKEQA